jgi:hypothetical protein
MAKERRFAPEWWRRATELGVREIVAAWLVAVLMAGVLLVIPMHRGQSRAASAALPLAAVLPRLAAGASLELGGLLRERCETPDDDVVMAAASHASGATAEC